MIDSFLELEDTNQILSMSIIFSFPNQYRFHFRLTGQTSKTAEIETSLAKHGTFRTSSSSFWLAEWRNWHLEKFLMLTHPSKHLVCANTAPSRFWIAFSHDAPLAPQQQGLRWDSRKRCWKRELFRNTTSLESRPAVNDEQQRTPRRSPTRTTKQMTTAADFFLD